MQKGKARNWEFWVWQSFLYLVCYGKVSHSGVSRNLQLLKVPLQGNSVGFDMGVVRPLSLQKIALSKL